MLSLIRSKYRNNPPLWGILFCYYYYDVTRSNGLWSRDFYFDFCAGKGLGKETAATLGVFQQQCGLLKTNILDGATRKKINELVKGPVVTATPVTTPKEVACTPLLTKMIYKNRKNDVTEVRKLQQFLIDQKYANVKVNGSYDAQTIAAVNQLQEKYLAEILTPVQETKGTGNVLGGTTKKINALYCAGK